jgi:hypothetical protein
MQAVSMAEEMVITMVAQVAVPQIFVWVVLHSLIALLLPAAVAAQDTTGAVSKAALVEVLPVATARHIAETPAITTVRAVRSRLAVLVQLIQVLQARPDRLDRAAAARQAVTAAVAAVAATTAVVQVMAILPVAVVHLILILHSVLLLRILRVIQDQAMVRLR